MYHFLVGLQWSFDGLVIDVQDNEVQEKIEDELPDFYVGGGVVLISGVSCGCFWVCRRVKFLSVFSLHFSMIIYSGMLAITLVSMLFRVV